MATDSKAILKELKEIKSDVLSIKVELDYLKEHVIDPDTVMDKADLKALTDAKRDEKERKLVSLDEVKKILGI